MFLTGIMASRLPAQMCSFGSKLIITPTGIMKKQKKKNILQIKMATSN